MRASKKILRFAVDSVLYYCGPMNRRAFTLRPSVVIFFLTVPIALRIHFLVV